MMALGDLLSIPGITTFLLAHIAAALPATSTDLHYKDPLVKYKLVDLSWNLVVHPKDFPKVTTTFNGTIENAIQQALVINPSFLAQHGFITSHFYTRQPDLSASTSNNATAAPPQSLKNLRKALMCGGMPEVEPGPITKGIQYLRGIPGHPENAPGPDSCGRVSCGWDAAIWWCNDSTQEIFLESFTKIADSAQTIVDMCQHGFPSPTVAGQIFYMDNWNVFIRNERC